jgi:hypothetical protein
MTRPPIQATLTISPYRLVRILNLASLNKKLNRLYLNIKEDRLDTYGFNNGLISYCTFTSPYLDGIELQRNEPVGAIVDVQSWYDTASRLNTSRNKPETIRDHEFHRSITRRERRKQRRKAFYDQYTDNSSLCIIELHSERDSDIATHRKIITQNTYEDPLPTPRLTLVYWEKCSIENGRRKWD